MFFFFHVSTQKDTHKLRWFNPQGVSFSTSLRAFYGARTQYRTAVAWQKRAVSTIWRALAELSLGLRGSLLLQCIGLLEDVLRMLLWPADSITPRRGDTTDKDNDQIDFSLIKPLWKLFLRIDSEDPIIGLSCAINCQSSPYCYLLSFINMSCCHLIFYFSSQRRGTMPISSGKR